MPARPEIRASLSLRMLVLSVVILGDFAEYTWISRVFLKRFFLVEDKETLNLSPNRKKRYRRLFNCRSNCRITETSA